MGGLAHEKSEFGSIPKCNMEVFCLFFDIFFIIVHTFADVIPIWTNDEVTWMLGA